jgi:hypothetical protein
MIRRRRSQYLLTYDQLQESWAERDAEQADRMRLFGRTGLSESIDWSRDPAEVEAEAEAQPDHEEDLVEVFVSLGMSESAARVAARGRVLPGESRSPRPAAATESARGGTAPTRLTEITRPGVPPASELRG